MMRSNCRQWWWCRLIRSS